VGGFRALIFRDADELFIQSHDEKPLGSYYPELIEPLKFAVAATLRAMTDWRGIGTTHCVAYGAGEPDPLRVGL
jgi:hypothetical protein